MSTKSSPENFKPEVWTMDGWPPMLVCGRNWMNGGPVTTDAARQRVKDGKPTGPLDKRVWKSILHPAAIQLDPIRVGYGFTGGTEGGTWTRNPPEDHGISSRCAALALAEAWRGVEVSVDCPSRHGTIKTDVGTLTGFRGKSTVMRDVLIYLFWDRWNLAKTPISDRVQTVNQCGAQGQSITRFSITKKALVRLVEKAGLSIVE
jgi:hypothetical protein